MFYALLKTLHLLALIVWLGGMVFAHFFLRPAVATLTPAQRLPLMHAVLGRFFNAVLGAAGLVFLSGFWMLGRVAKVASQAGVPYNMPLEWLLMAVLGTVMMAIFGHIRFTLFKRLSQAVAASDWPAGGAVLGSIRHWVVVNLCIGLLIVLLVMIGSST